MKNKKLLSTILAATLAATTMAMPVMASEVSGDVPVDITDKDYILRVQVPTKLEVEIDPYEIAQPGSQIASTEFGMTNLSQVNVEVKVASKLTKKSGSKYSLVSSKKTAKDSTSTSGDAWVAIAAKTSASGDASGDAYKEGTAKDYAALTESNKNVTTFNASGDASQTFYLAQASGDAKNPVYTQVVPTAAGESGTPYAQFYELDKESSILAVSGDATSGDIALKAVLKQKDVFFTTSGDADKNGKNLTKISKGASTPNYAVGNIYYVIKDGTTVVGENDLVANKTYMYSAMQIAGGEAGFRYIGNFSSKKTGGWSEDDFGGITINYTIKGVPQSEFAEKNEKCTYGLYANGPSISVSAAGLITMAGFTADKNYVSATLTNDNGTFDINAAPVEWDNTEWSSDNGGTLTGQLGDVWMDSLRGKTGSLKVTVTGGEVITVPITIPSA